MSLSGLLPLLGQTEQFAALVNSLRAPRAQAALIAPDPAIECTVAALWCDQENLRWRRHSDSGGNLAWGTYFAMDATCAMKLLQPAPPQPAQAPLPPTA